MNLSFNRISLFGQLLLIYFIAAVLFIFIAVGAFKYLGERPFQKAIRKNIATYTELLSQKIGVSPGRDIIDRLAEQSSLTIGFIGPKLRYITEDKFPSLKGYKKKVINTKLTLYTYQHQKVFVYENEIGKFYYSLNKSMKYDFNILPFIITIFFGVFILLMAYFFVRKLFSPLEDIEMAADQYKKGNFNFNFSNKGHSQLLKLSNSMKEMALQIDSMLTSKRELLIAIAHELKTPLARMRLHGELLGEDKHSLEINENINEMNDLVEQLLEAERSSFEKAYKYVETSFSELVEESISSSRSDKQSFELNLDQNIILSVDPLRYQLALKSIVANAILYGEGEPIIINLNSKSLEIIDFGPGVKDEELSKLSDPFYRVDNSRERSSGGTGLGLYLVSQVVKAHKHELQISNSEGAGLKVKILF